MCNRIIAIGDIHGSAKWKDIVDENKNATIVFLGDYLDPYHINDYDELWNNFVDIIRFKQDNIDRVVLLLGNHDLHYFCDDMSIGTRYNFLLAERIRRMFLNNRELFQYAYQVKNIIFTHAGISHPWFVNDFKGDIHGDIAAQLNAPDDRQVQALFQVGAVRGGDAGLMGGIFWADRSELNDPLHGFVQVVGHNRVDDVIELAYADHNKIIFCDCLWNGKFFKISI